MARVIEDDSLRRWPAARQPPSNAQGRRNVSSPSTSTAGMKCIAVDVLHRHPELAVVAAAVVGQDRRGQPRRARGAASADVQIAATLRLSGRCLGFDAGFMVEASPAGTPGFASNHSSVWIGRARAHATTVCQWVHGATNRPADAGSRILGTYRRNVRDDDGRGLPDAGHDGSTPRYHRQRAHERA
jgi:hypothetical protein